MSKADLGTVLRMFNVSWWIPTLKCILNKTQTRQKVDQLVPGDFFMISAVPEKSLKRMAWDVDQCIFSLRNSKGYDANVGNKNLGAVLYRANALKMMLQPRTPCTELPMVSFQNKFYVMSSVTL